MAFVTDSDRDRIAEAIRAVERRTSGELVAVIAAESDSYYYIPTLWAALIAIVLSGAAELLDLLPQTGLYLTAELALFVVLALAFRWTPLKMRLVPPSVKRSRAAVLARAQFVEQGLHLTRDHTGVLIFVSVAEHYVEVMADKGINDRVDAAVWQGAVDAFVMRVKAGQVADGFLEAIERCGAVLTEHFPRAEGDVDELPNRLIEI